MSKYPPGQAAVLALGMLLGHPHNGVILSFGLFVLTTVWVLRSLVPLKWALFGGCWTLLVFNVRLYWLESYWGGFVAAIGGNLVLASLLYWFRHNRERACWWFVPGALVLALTRPFEGMAFVLSVAVSFFVWQSVADRRQFFNSVRAWTLPVLAAAVLVASVVGTYHWRTMGSPFRFPYLEYERQYGMVPIFWPQSLRDVHFDDPRLERLYTEWSADEYRYTRDRPAATIIPYQLVRIGFVAVVTIFGLSAIAILIAFFYWRNVTIRILGCALILTSLFLSLEVWIFPHYLAPAMGLLIGLAVCGLVEAQNAITQRGRKPWLVRCILVLAIVDPLVQTVRAVQSARKEGLIHGVLPIPIRYKDNHREVIERTLEQMGGNHVVFIRYSPTHDVHQEWIYNSPDIDAQRVVWARDRGEENVKLEAYYPGRKFWILEPDQPSAELQPVRDAVTETRMRLQ